MNFDLKIAVFIKKINVKIGKFKILLGGGCQIYRNFEYPSKFKNCY